MKNSFLSLVVLCILLSSCKNKKETPNKIEQNPLEEKEDTNIVRELSDKLTDVKPVTLTLEEANKLARLPLTCITNEYPNKLSQVLSSEKDLRAPSTLHPAFFGCFDWHSSVHAHWSLVRLLKKFPKLNKAPAIKKQLLANISKENIKKEVLYFQKKANKSFERTYGWAWLLKLAEEIHTWDDSIARPLEKNLQPLTNQIVKNYRNFLPKLNYPVRVGEHENTAFGLTFAYDYAQTTENEPLKDMIVSRAKKFYLTDHNCPLEWEPGGFDFLSPCLEEVDLMQRILAKQAFMLWVKNFLPQLLDKDFTMEPGEVSDRNDGKLVHLDGLNFSRAWVFYDLANKYKAFSHLRKVADQHAAYSFPHVVNDHYEGGHWLGTFAIYALSKQKNTDDYGAH